MIPSDPFMIQGILRHKTALKRLRCLHHVLPNESGAEARQREHGRAWPRRPRERFRCGTTTMRPRALYGLYVALLVQDHAGYTARRLATVLFKTRMSEGVRAMVFATAWGYRLKASKFSTATMRANCDSTQRLNVVGSANASSL